MSRSSKPRVKSVPARARPKSFVLPKSYLQRIGHAQRECPAEHALSARGVLCPPRVIRNVAKVFGDRHCEALAWISPGAKVLGIAVEREVNCHDEELPRSR